MKINEIKYTSKSHQILSESVWQQLDEDTQKYINRWEKELWPILEEYQNLTEQELKPDDIQNLFKDAEQLASGKEEYQTDIGKAGQKAANAGKAVVGGVKIAVGVAQAINNKINELGKVIQDTTPVQNIDAAFEKGKKDLYNVLGGKDAKINQHIEKLSELAKEHPGKSKFAVALLTTVMAFATGPGGGAVAGYALRAGLDLLQGEKLSTAVGKGAKFAAYGWLAGKAFELVSEPFKDWIQSANADEINQAAKIEVQTEMRGVLADINIDQAEISKQFADAQAQLKANGMENMVTANPGEKFQRFTSSKGGSITFGGEFHLPNQAMADEYRSQIEGIKTAWDKLQDAPRPKADNMLGFDPSGVSPEMQDAYMEVRKKLTYFNGWKAGVDLEFPQDLANSLVDKYKELQVLQDQIMDRTKDLRNLKGEIAPKVADILGNLSDDLQNNISVLDRAQDFLQSVLQGATTVKSQGESIELKYLAGIPLTEAEEKILQEIKALDYLKKAGASAAKAAKVVGGAVAKAGGAVAGAVGKGAKKVGKELGNNITVSKLNDIWKERGSPNTLDLLYSVLEFAGLKDPDIKKLIHKYDATKMKKQPGPIRKSTGGDSIDIMRGAKRPSNDARKSINVPN